MKENFNFSSWSPTEMQIFKLRKLVSIYYWINSLNVKIKNFTEKIIRTRNQCIKIFL